MASLHNRVIFISNLPARRKWRQSPQPLSQSHSSPLTPVRPSPDKTAARRQTSSRRWPPQRPPCWRARRSCRRSWRPCKWSCPGRRSGSPRRSWSWSAWRSASCPPCTWTVCWNSRLWRMGWRMDNAYKLGFWGKITYAAQFIWFISMAHFLRYGTASCPIFVIKCLP